MKVTVWKQGPMEGELKQDPEKKKEKQDPWTSKV